MLLLAFLLGAIALEPITAAKTTTTAPAPAGANDTQYNGTVMLFIKKWGANEGGKNPIPPFRPPRPVPPFPSQHSDYLPMNPPPPQDPAFGQPMSPMQEAPPAPFWPSDPQNPPGLDYLPMNPPPPQDPAFGQPMSPMQEAPPAPFWPSDPQNPPGLPYYQKNGESHPAYPPPYNPPGDSYANMAYPRETPPVTFISPLPDSIELIRPTESPKQLAEDALIEEWLEHLPDPPKQAISQLLKTSKNSLNPIEFRFIIGEGNKTTTERPESSTKSSKQHKRTGRKNKRGTTTTTAPTGQNKSKRRKTTPDPAKVIENYLKTTKMQKSVTQASPPAKSKKRHQTTTVKTPAEDAKPAAPKRRNAMQYMRHQFPSPRPHMVNRQENKPKPPTTAELRRQLKELADFKRALAYNRDAVNAP